MGIYLFAKQSCNKLMDSMTSGEIRLANLRQLIAEYGSSAELSRVCGLSPSHLSQIVSEKANRSVGPTLARKIELGAGKRRGWMDQDHSASNVEPGPRIRGDVPVISWVQAGVWSDIVDNFQQGDAELWLPCIAGHSPQTFALRIMGLSMLPKYPPGNIIFVDPNAQYGNMSFVIAKQDDKEKATFKQLFTEDGPWYLKALNPDFHGKIMDFTEATRICGVVLPGQWVPG